MCILLVGLYFYVAVYFRFGVKKCITWPRSNGKKPTQTQPTPKRAEQNYILNEIIPKCI